MIIRVAGEGEVGSPILADAIAFALQSEAATPRRLTLRRGHLLLGEAQNGGAITLPGCPGSLEAIDHWARASQR